MSRTFSSQATPARAHAELNRPAALNSFTTELHAELMAAFESAAGGRQRALRRGHRRRPRLLRRPGSRRSLGRARPHARRRAQGPGPRHRRLYAPLVARLRSMPVPVVAAVNGVAAGAGANLALCCDLVVAGRSASFIQAFTKIGLVPDTGGTWLLPRLVGSARALGMRCWATSCPPKKRAHGPDLAVRGRRGIGRTGRRARAKPEPPCRPALVATRQAMAAARHMDLEAALAKKPACSARSATRMTTAKASSAFRAKRAPSSRTAES
jgi:2-(1,2-epoxy-1,2-dihydrophenyl)acetyl-CoA isomerase